MCKLFGPNQITWFFEFSHYFAYLVRVRRAGTRTHSWTSTAVAVLHDFILEKLTFFNMMNLTDPSEATTMAEYVGFLLGMFTNMLFL